MTKIVGYIVMILLSGSCAALSSFLGGIPGMWRAFILGSVLALSVALGDYLKDKLKSNLAQSVLGMLLGAVAGVLIVLFKLKVHNREMGINFNSESMIILLSIIYGGFFQWIVMSRAKLKRIKLLFVAFICISIKFYYVNPRFEFGDILAVSLFSAISALLFTLLWYLPVWFFYIRKQSIASYIRSVPLNLRMFKLVLKRRWLSKRDYALSYDKVAATYDEQWLCQLRPVTEKLLAALPVAGQGDILDLGCGTGLSTLYLEDKYLENAITGVDISPKMLNIAKEKCSRSEFVEGDILNFLQSRSNNSAGLIFSGWAIGYSKPSDIISQAERVLKPGGTFAFVVNYSDTLAPVFYSFRKCMNKFPGQVKMALNPKFPNEAKDLLKTLKNNKFSTQMQEDGNIPIHSPEGKITLDWLLKTGVLAGFDQVMPLHDNPEIAEYFNKILNEFKEAVEHHYFMGVFINK